MHQPVTGFTGLPRLLKGAVSGLDPTNPLASVVILQYSPDTLVYGPADARRGGAQAVQCSRSGRIAADA
jgi:hypothetical protein